MTQKTSEKSDPVYILGGGLTGISTAYHLERPYQIIEAKAHLGGLATTEEKEGFFFDHTGHWLHLRDPYMKNLVGQLLNVSDSSGGWRQVKREARIFSHQRTTQYPFQANLHELPQDVIYECLLGYVQALKSRDENEPRNFEEYIHHHFGSGIAKYFMVPYNSKLWGVSPKEITSAWCSRFVPIPSTEQVIAGALGSGPAQLGYNVEFSYPEKGGIESFTRALIAKLPNDQIALNTRPESIDHLNKTITINGETSFYSALVSTIPLPKLVNLIKNAPDEILAAKEKLRATTLRYLNLASKKSPADWHWIYVPQKDLPFYRVGIFSNAIESMAPKDHSSFYVELSSRDEVDESAKRDAIAGLIAIGALNSAEDVVFADNRLIDPAYVIFDENYEEATSTIHRYLEKHQIYSRGRYGEWIYNSMEDSLISGKEIALKLSK